MKMNIALLPGDGIGPEVIAQAVKVVEAIGKKFGHQISFQHGLVGACAIDATGDPYPDATHDICAASDAVLFGAIGDPKYDNDPKAKVRPEQGLLRMRQKLGLFANVRPTFTFPSLVHKSPLKLDRVDGVDLVFFRELTEASISGSLEEETSKVPKPMTPTSTAKRRLYVWHEWVLRLRKSVENS